VSNLAQDLTKYSRLFLLPILIFVAIILSGVFFLKPKLEQVVRIKTNLSREKTRLAELTTKLAALEGLDVNELEVKTNVVLQALPVEKDVPQILLAIRGLTQSVGTELRSVQVEPGEISTESAQIKTSKKYDLPFLVFKITIAGNLEQLKEFLLKIESIAPLMRVDKIDISQKEGMAEADLDLDTFFLPLPVSLGVTEKQLSSITAQEEKIYQKLSKLEEIQPGESLPSITSGKTNPFAF